MLMLNRDPVKSLVCELNYSHCGHVHVSLTP